MTKRRNTWIQTASGVAFDLLSPKPEDVRTSDLGFALAWTMRFTGHAGGYSVAAHSTYVGRLLAHRYPDLPGLALAGHLHDAHEAYIGDLSSPMKACLGNIGDDYREIDRRNQAAVMRRYGVSEGAGKWAEVVEADLAMLDLEREFLLGPEAQPWNLPVGAPTPEERVAIGWPALGAKYAHAHYGVFAEETWVAVLRERLEAVGRGGIA